VKYLFTFLLSINFFIAGFSQALNPDYQAYIEKFHTIAIRQQKTYGIPASIILAQGLLESGAGRGMLATEANNHFGIKCHDWTGKKIYKDDDEKNECFRKYKHAHESYEDHSLFLVNRPRYSSLFLLSPTDYVGWAHGLKNAGYATDPAYAQKLISLIERYDLHQYDMGKKGSFTTKTSHESDLHTKSEREIYKSNHLKIVVATEYDTYASLAEELQISEKRLRKYNEVGTDAQLKAGNIVYLSKKKKRAAYANRIHVVQPGETLYGISQIYGIQLISLYKMNDIPFTQGAFISQIIKLR